MNKKGERETRVPIHPTTHERRDRGGLEPRLASHTAAVVLSRIGFWCSLQELIHHNDKVST